MKHSQRMSRYGFVQRKALSILTRHLTGAG